MKRRLFFSISELFGELKRRGVYPVIAGYAVIAWIVLQIGEVTFQPLGLPDWAMTILVVLAILGFPLVVALSWTFDITPFGLRRDQPAGAQPVADESPSIAVLPFVDMSPDKDQGYFCEGVAEEILNALTRISGLHVVARMSSFRYAGRQGDIQEIGRKLGVNAILEGSVRKAGNRLRVTAQLIKASDGYHLWSKSYDEDLADIFAIQDEIATSIANKLLDTLTPIRTTTTRDIAAYDYYLRGRQFFHRFRKTNIEYAIEMFRHAIDIDSDFALAWAGYADCFSFLLMYSDPKPGYRTKATDASVRALQLGEDLAEAHASRGLAHLVCDEFAEAESEFEKALELNPRLYEAHYYFARTRFHQGDMEQAAEYFRRAAEVNPAEYQARCLRIQILRGAGQIDKATAEASEAIRVLEKHLEWNPDDTRALQLGAGSLALTGDRERAIRWLKRALEIDPNDSIVLYNVACNYATMGEVEQALDYLEAANRHGIVSLDWMANDEDLANLRDHDRYKTLIRLLEQKKAG